MTSMPFFPLSTDAYLADTGHLTDAEHGRYLQILIALWRAPKQRLPNDDEWLARKFHRDPERVRSELRPLIVEFCDLDGNWIFQKRLCKEFKRCEKQVTQRSEAAKVRWLKEKIERERIANAYGGRTAPTLIPIPIESESSSSEISTDPARGAALPVAGSAPRASGAGLTKTGDIVAQLAVLNRLKQMRDA